MTKITIDKDISLSKTHFKDLEELQMELILQNEAQYELTDEHKSILDQRKAQLNKSENKGIPWKEVRSKLKRKNA